MPYGKRRYNLRTLKRIKENYNFDKLNIPEDKKQIVDNLFMIFIEHKWNYINTDIAKDWKKGYDEEQEIKKITEILGPLLSEKIFLFYLNDYKKIKIDLYILYKIFWRYFDKPKNY